MASNSIFYLPVFLSCLFFILNSISCEYDVPRPAAVETYDTPRLVAITNNTSAGSTSPTLLSSSTLGDEYDVPVAAGVAAMATRFQNRHSNNNGNNLSDRSSGVSLFSSGSSDGSSAISNANRSISSESLSLSSAVGRISGRSSRSSVIDQQQPSFELYDVPPSTHQAVKEILPVSQAIQEEVYDVPKSSVLTSTVVPDLSLYDIPPPAVSAVIVTEDKVAQGGQTYDIPPNRPVATQVQIVTPSSSSEEGDTYDSPKPLLDWTDKVSSTLPLSLDAALETLSRLDAEVSSALCNLLSFWRSASGGDWAELQLRVLRLRSSLQELCDFTRGAIGNASQRIKNGDDDQGVAIRLTRLLRPLQDDNAIIQKTSQSCTDLFTTSRRAIHNGIDGELEQLLACCRNLSDDMRQVMYRQLA